MNRPLAPPLSLRTARTPADAEASFRRLGSRIWKRLRRNTKAGTGLIILGLLTVILVTGAGRSPRQALEQNLQDRLKPPVGMADGSWSHPAGTDQLGRDILARLVVGGRISLWLGVISSVLAGLVGVIVGVVAGFYVGRTDAVLMTVADVQLAFPSILLALAVLVVLGGGMAKLVGVLVISNWVFFARVVRAEVLRLKSLEFVDAARALGASDLRILSRHLLTNITASILVLFSLTLVRVILAEAALSYLGLGVPPPRPSWGGMLSEAQAYLSGAWWLATAPGVALTGLVLSVNLVADGLRDVLDPRMVQAA